MPHMRSVKGQGGNRANAQDFRQNRIVRTVANTTRIRFFWSVNIRLFRLVFAFTWAFSIDRSCEIPRCNITRLQRQRNERIQDDVTLRGGNPDIASSTSIVTGEGFFCIETKEARFSLSWESLSNSSREKKDGEIERNEREKEGHGEWIPPLRHRKSPEPLASTLELKWSQ